MTNWATSGILAATLILLATEANRAHAADGSQNPALRRVARQIGRALDRDNKTDVHVVLGSNVSGEVAELILAQCKQALVADPLIENVSDDASYTARVDYLRSDLRVCLDLVLLNSRNESVGTFSANFDLELPAESETVAKRSPASNR